MILCVLSCSPSLVLPILMVWMFFRLRIDMKRSMAVSQPHTMYLQL
jgi:hypothetical protein